MENLNYLLSVLNDSSSAEDIQSTFAKIAKILLFKSHIKTSYGNYRILEIEFYFFNQNHKDTVTMYREEEPGMWWLHEWGVDLSFKSEKEYYGGILIRSILDEEDNKYICGPQKCCQELFYSSAFKETLAPRILEDVVYTGMLATTKRQIRGRNNGVNERYRYFVKDVNMEEVKNYKESPWNKSI